MKQFGGEHVTPVSWRVAGKPSRRESKLLNRGFQSESRRAIQPTHPNGGAATDRYRQPIPVGVVSNTYRLAQHKEVVEMCFKGLKAHGIDPQVLRCEVGLTSLGEWMNFRAYFPESYSHSPKDGNKLALRLRCSIP